MTNAPSYQLLISAFGVVPEDDKLIGNVNPWAGFRVGIIGDVG